MTTWPKTRAWRTPWRTNDPDEDHLWVRYLMRRVRGPFPSAWPHHPQTGLLQSMCQSLSLRLWIFCFLLKSQYCSKYLLSSTYLLKRMKLSERPCSILRKRGGDLAGDMLLGVCLSHTKGEKIRGDCSLFRKCGTYCFTWNKNPLLIYA